MDLLRSLLEDQCRLHPNNFAVVGQGRIFTYSVLNSLVTSISSVLYNSGVKSNCKVAIISENNFDYISLILALWSLGAIPVPINIKLHFKEINYILDFCKPDFVYMHKDIPATIYPERETKSFPFTLPDDIRNILNAPRSNDDAALVMFTSGATGVPKGVTLTYKNLYKSCIATDDILHQGAGDKWLLSLPLYHIGGFMILVRALFYGCSIIIPDTNSTNDILFSIKNLKPNYISLVPTQLKKIIDEGIKPDSELKSVLIGGGPADDEIIIEAVKEGWKINKVYGMTETAAFITALEFRDFANKYKSVGKPLSGVEIKISCSKETSGVNKNGEILIKSPTVMKEYSDNPGETSIKLNDGYFYSGDIGYLDEEGFLYIESRRTDLIITGGENVNPLEVEKQILNYPIVEEVCVIGEEDKKWGQCVAAVIVTKGGAELDFEELKEFLTKSLAVFKIPKKIYYTDELPKTSLGKIKRQEVREKYNQY